MHRVASWLLLAALGLALAARPLPAATSASGFPRFTTFGWLAPPPEWTDSLHVSDYAGAGMNVLLPAWRDSGLIADTQARLDLAREHGMTCIAWDRRLRQVNPQDPATYAILDSIVALLRNQPGFLAYYLGDEPAADRLPLIAGFFARLAERDPDHPGWNNLNGRNSFASHDEFLAFTRLYVSMVRPAVLCNDHYDLLVDGDLGQQVENVRGLAQVARESGLPFWGIIQFIAHRPFRAPSEGELRWQIGTWLSYGARGIGWFSYWTPDFNPLYDWQPALVDTVGNRTPAFETARRINRDARAVGVELAGMAWSKTQYAGSQPSYGDAFAPDSTVAGVEGRACVAAFIDSLGREVRLVANSDSMRSQEITLLLGPKARLRVEQLEAGAGAWSSRPACGSAGAPAVRLALGPGEFVLLRFTPGGPGASLAPARLAARPNPARGTVDLVTDGCASGDRIVLSDAAGRRVRTLAVPRGGGPVLWRGERDDGGRAPAGVYFARLGLGLRAVTRRVVWAP